MIPYKRSLLFAILLIILTSGCATSGNKIEVGNIQKIQEGVTTEQEVIAIMGSPQIKTLTSDGKTIMMYHYVKVKNRAINFIPFGMVLAGGMDMNQQMFSVLIGTDGKVEKYTFNDSQSEINTGLFNQ